MHFFPSKVHVMSGRSGNLASLSRRLENGIYTWDAILPPHPSSFRFSLSSTSSLLNLLRRLVMRLTSLVPLLSALHFVLPCAFARLDRPLRQHHKSRALLDVCAYIDADTLAQTNTIGIPADILVDLDFCLCLSALPLALKTNANLKVLTDLLGNTVVDAFLSAIASIF